MKRFLLLAISFFFLSALCAHAQKSDMELINEHDSEVSAAPADSSSTIYRIWHGVRREMAGMCYFDPCCVEFFPQAVKTIGPLRAVLATVDRLTRCTQIGQARRIMRGGPFPVREGPEAYAKKATEE